MKLKLFIVTFIALSLAVTGVLGGCGDKNKDGKRDNTIIVSIMNGENTDIRSVGKVDNNIAVAGYTGDEKLLWVAVYRMTGVQEGYLDTLYVLSGVIPENDQIIMCMDRLTEEIINFTATSSKSSIASLENMISNKYLSTSRYTTGEAKISIETADHRKTWFKVIVVDKLAYMPTFIP